MVNVGLIVIACGAVVTLLASGISKDPMVLTFGVGPMLLGFVVVLTGFFGPKKAANKPLPVWKTLIVPVAILAIALPRLLFDYRFPHWTRPYLLVAVAILCVVALWPIHPAEGGEDHS